MEKKTDYLLAVFLIFLGFVLLLNTAGLIEWDIWSILWRFWPLLIVFAGLSIIFEGSKVLSIVIAVLSLIALSLIFLWSSEVIERPNWFERVVEKEVELEETYVLPFEEYDGVEKKEMHVEMNVGSLNIGNGELEGFFKLDSQRYSDWDEPEIDVEFRNSILESNIVLGKKGTWFFGGSSTSPDYILTLGSGDYLTDLFLDVGAGRSDVRFDGYLLNDVEIDLGAGRVDARFLDTDINKLYLEVGAGNLSVELTGDTNVTRDVHVEVGVGKLTLVLPEDAEYKLDVDVGLGSVKTPNGLISENYEDAEKRFNIVGEVGVGQLVIK